MKYVLGIQTGHDAAAALLIDGEIVADLAEERLTRVKNDSSFPLKAIDFCLNFAGIATEELDAIALPNSYLHPDVKIFLTYPPCSCQGKAGQSSPDSNRLHCSMS